MVALVESIKIIARKEMYELIKTKRFLIIGVLYLLAVVIIALYHGIVEKSTPTQMVNTMEFGIANWMFPCILAIVLGYDQIAGEKSKRTFIFLLTRPIDREGIYLGKFCAILLSIFILYISVVSIGYWLESILSAKYPSSGDVGKVYGYFGVTFLGICCWLALTLFFSTISKTPSTCLIIIVLLFIIVIPIISMIGVMAAAPELFATPPEGNETEDTPLQNITKKEFPWYAKVCLAVDPQYPVRSIGNELFGGEDPFAILSVRESIIALIIFFSINFFSTFFIFRRIDLVEI